MSVKGVDGGRSYQSMRDMDPSDSWEPYVAAIYWAFTTMTTVSRILYR